MPESRLREPLACPYGDGNGNREHPPRQLTSRTRGASRGCWRVGSRGVTYAERALRDGLCCVTDCGMPRIPGLYRCVECRRKYRREYSQRYYYKNLSKRRYDELCLAVALTAAYMSGYRHGCGDRAMALTDQHRRARAAEAQRTQDGLTFRLSS